MKLFPKTLQHHSGKKMIQDETRLLISLKDQTKRIESEKLENMLKNTGFVLEENKTEFAKSDKKIPRSSKVINHTNKRIWIRSLESKVRDQSSLDKLQRTLENKIDWIAPVYNLEGKEGENEDNIICPLPNVLIIKPRTKNKEEMDKILSKYGLKVVPEKSKYLIDYIYCIIENIEEIYSYDLQKIIVSKESQLISDVQFENMPFIVPTAILPNDPMFGNQWDMMTINAGGGGFTGWDITTGSEDIVVCMLDEGCDLTHPDLRFSDAGINLDTMLPDGSPTGNHGTACAGIVSAIFNNTEGLSGVAGNCKILPLAFVNWTEIEVANGINYAADHGARVISMSFGWDPWNPAIIDPAIQHAFDSNVVMCVATHNHNGSITYPATNPLVIACGASDQIDNRKSPTSPDGEAWGSNFGPEMSVVAPGVLIPTTDIQGSNGYTPNDYMLDFNGTSSATPHVAGLAALLLSKDPTLSNQQIRNIIEQTSDKVGQVAYINTPGKNNGLWNEEMGYGRIDVLKALWYFNINQIQIQVKTGNSQSAGTNGKVYLGIGGREFRLNKAGNQFEGGIDSFEILTSGTNDPNEINNHDEINSLNGTNAPTIDSIAITRNPKYIRFEPQNDNDNWQVNSIVVTVTGNANLQEFRGPIGGNIWLGTRFGIILRTCVNNLS